MYNRGKLCRGGRGSAVRDENKGAEPGVDQAISGVEIGLSSLGTTLHFAIGFLV